MEVVVMYSTIISSDVLLETVHIDIPALSTGRELVATSQLTVKDTRPNTNIAQRLIKDTRQNTDIAQDQQGPWLCSSSP